MSHCSVLRNYLSAISDNCPSLTQLLPPTHFNLLCAILNLIWECFRNIKQTSLCLSKRNWQIFPALQLANQGKKKSDACSVNMLKATSQATNIYRVSLRGHTGCQWLGQGIWGALFPSPPALISKPPHTPHYLTFLAALRRVCLLGVSSSSSSSSSSDESGFFLFFPRWGLWGFLTLVLATVLK